MLLGLLIAGYFRDVQGEAFKQRKIYRYRYWIAGAAFVLFSLRQIDRISMIGPSLTYITAGYLDFDFFLCSGIASAIFLVWLVSSRHLQRWITGSVFLFFGKISYGIYLMHWLVLLVIINSWDAISRIMPDEGIRFGIMLLVCIAGTILSATVLYYFIELPAIRWGKRLTARWCASVVP